MEKTFALLKPDTTGRRLIGEIIARIERKGLAIAELQMLTLDETDIEELYAPHVNKSFFPDLKKFMLSGPVVAMVIKGDNAIKEMRKLNGATDPFEANPGTIRGDLALSKTQNIIHSSDSPAEAAREMAIFFPNSI